VRWRPINSLIRSERIIGYGVRRSRSRPKGTWMEAIKEDMPRNRAEWKRFM